MPVAPSPAPIRPTPPLQFTDCAQQVSKGDVYPKMLSMHRGLAALDRARMQSGSSEKPSVKTRMGLPFVLAQGNYDGPRRSVGNDTSGL